MKKLIHSFIILTISATVFAQAPQSFKYQAVARDASGEVIADQKVSFQISILQSSESGTAIYTETHVDSTNQFGLVTLEIGTGTTTDDFTGIDWGNDAYFIQIEMDASGGTSYTLMGTSQLLSVPYAMHARTVENVDDDDADSTNELQIISFNNDTLYLSNANYVTLPYDSALWVLNDDYVSYNGGIKIGLSSTCNSSTKGTIRYVEANNKVQICDGEKWVDFAPVLTLSLDKINVSCNGGSDGSIDISISGGNPPYSYDWSNGYTTQYINGLTSGIHSVVVTDSKGYTITESITITEPVVLSTTLYGSDVTCNGISNGAVNLTVTGGTDPYTYQWSNSSISEDINNLSAGLYKVTISDANGCTKKDSITISEPTVLSLSITGIDITCNGGSDGSVDLTVSGGTSSYSYSWSNGATTEDISDLSANTYTVTVTDNNACSDNISITLTQPPALSLVLSGTNLICYGDNDGAVNLTVTGGTAPYLYSWSNGSTTEDISDLLANDYTVTVTDDNACIKTNNITITQPDSIELTLIRSDEALSYSDGAINLTVNYGIEPYTYNWSNGATTEDISNLSANTYTVTVTDANNCIVTDGTTINNITNVTDVDGNVYDIVKIGNQVWMSENLNVGTMIHNSYGGENNSGLQTGNGIIEKYCYDNNEAYCDTFGGLYVWTEMLQYFTLGSKGICPDGWHPPSDDEWMLLEMYLGMERAVAETTGWRGTDEGTQLKVGGSSGFEALMGGTGYPGTSYKYIGTQGHFRTTTSLCRLLYDAFSNIERDSYSINNAYSVRCIKD